MSKDSTDDRTEPGGEPSAPGEAQPLAQAPDSTAQSEDAFFNAPEAKDEPLEDDPELMTLPRRRRRRHPLVSLVVIGLSVYLLYFLRSDILFFFQPRVPQDLGPVDEALRQGTLRPHTHVKLTGTPDRKHALILEARFGGWESFFRLRQGRNRVFVQQHRERRATDQEVSSVHVGQLMPFDGLPYARTLAATLEKTMTVAHELDLPRLRPALAHKGSPSEVLDRDGLPARLTPDTQVWINVAYPDEWLVQLPMTHYATQADAERLLTGLNLRAAPEGEPSTRFHRFVVLLTPEQVPEVLRVLKQPGLQAELLHRQVSYKARFGQLAIERSGPDTSETLVIDARDPGFPARFVEKDGAIVPVRDRVVRVPAKALLFITTSSPFKVAEDALVLIDGKAPGDNWYFVAIGLMLLGFALVNTVILGLRLRERLSRQP